VLDLDVLTREDAVTLLRSCAPHLNRADAGMLAGRLGDLPLALAQAGAYLDRAQLPAADYLRLLDTHAARLFERGHAVGHAQTIATVWSISLDQLRAHHPAAVQLLHLCAWLAPEPIPTDLITNHPQHLPTPLATATADPLAMTDTIAALTDYSLVRRSNTGLLLHRLVQAVIREHPHPGQHHPLTTILALLRTDLPDDLDLPASWPRWRQLLPHVLAATDHPGATAPAVAAHTAWLLDHAGSYIHMFFSSVPSVSGDFHPAIRLLERALRIRENFRGPDHPEVAATLTQLGFALSDWGHDAAARAVLERALHIAEAGRGSDHPDIGAALVHLGAVLVYLGEPATAVPLLERALNITETSRGNMHPQTASALIRLGVAFQGIGQMDAAQPVLERGLTISRATYGAEHPWTGAAMTVLGSLLIVRGEPATAKPVLDRALRLRERAYGASTLAVSHALVPLGRALIELGEPVAARPLLERAVTLSGEILGADHPRHAVALSWLGNALRALGEPTAARPLLDQALRIQRAAFGPDHPWTANTMIQLSHVLSDLGEPTAAAALHAHASHIHQATYGPDHQPGEPPY
jgi:tetratricopeptide (TPR) repeat protein